MPASPPVAIAIPAIGVHAAVTAVGLNADGTLQVPQPGPTYNDAAWFRYSVTPGQIGPAVIEGHVDSAATGPSVFFRLGSLVPGDAVTITRGDGTTVAFRVTGVREYPKDAFPTEAVYGVTAAAELRLITCGGSFDTAAGHYRDNVVVFASVSPAPSGG